MNKKLLLSAAVGALIVSGALAQSPNSSPSSSSPVTQPSAATQAPSAGKARIIKRSATSAISFSTRQARSKALWSVSAVFSAWERKRSR